MKMAKRKEKKASASRASSLSYRDLRNMSRQGLKLRGDALKKLLEEGGGQGFSPYKAGDLNSNSSRKSQGSEHFEDE